MCYAAGCLGRSPRRSAGASCSSPSSNWRTSPVRSPIRTSARARTSARQRVPAGPRGARGRHGLRRFEDDEARDELAESVRVEVDQRVVLVDVGDRACTVLGVQDPIAFRETFHSEPPGSLPRQCRVEWAASAFVTIGRLAYRNGAGRLWPVPQASSPYPRLALVRAGPGRPRLRKAGQQ